jgi:hypothetical protein
MQIGAMVDGGIDAFNAIAYGVSNENNINYNAMSINNFKDKLGHILPDFTNKAVDTFKRFNSEIVINNAKSIINKVMGVDVKQDEILFYGPNNIGNANTIMSNYILANPKIGELFNRQMCHGFADTYIHTEDILAIKENNSYWCKAVNGTAIEEDGEEFGIFISSDETDENIRDIEKADILNTWEVAESMLENGIDPTDPEYGEL